ncbi:MAG TPA: hypothetical protein VKR55_15945 [Bradyrhizobium sp.]|uniref:hypothetical protein n=1 Tax=Bradyrhizobium sp. TaxID=376 RepID=UPI002BC15046|nr:hypothetical protein [Bradyrhizobium sp.]HLZ03627.1 hypothetical protein [Bradyrhizobium sp.]
MFTERHNHIHQYEWKLNIQQHVSEIASLARGPTLSVGSLRLESEIVSTGIGGDATMSKQGSRRKRVAKAAAVPALGAAGLTFSLAGGASASALPNADTPQKLNFSPSQSVLLGEEEIADVSLATFHLFDKENGGNTGFQQMAWGCRCGGCRCGGCRGCGCRCGGCRGCGCGGCVVGPCCLTWGFCRLC